MSLPSLSDTVFDRLEPVACPFCHGSAVMAGRYSGGFAVRCDDCGARGPVDLVNNAGAIAAWNRAAPPKCLSCGDPDAACNECPNSKRPCGHHCDCSWSLDICHWCGAEFGGDDDGQSDGADE
jgi:hypothetical protein